MEEAGGPISFGFKVSHKKKKSLRKKGNEEAEREDIGGDALTSEFWDLTNTRTQSRWAYLKSREQKKLEELADDLAFEEELRNRLSEGGGFKFSKEEIAAYERKKHLYDVIKQKVEMEDKSKDSFYFLPGSPKHLGGTSQMPPSVAQGSDGASQRSEEKYSLAQWEDVQVGKAVQSKASKTNQEQYPYVFDPLEDVDWASLSPTLLADMDCDNDAPGSPGDGKDLTAGLMQLDDKIERKEDLMKSIRENLPIAAYREQLLTAVRNNKVLIVVGETGSGKSTQIPQYLYESLRRTMLADVSMDEGHGKKLPMKMKIGITQPRRVAAMSLAKRVSEEMGERLGGLVGYSIRFEERVSEATRIEYMTDGMLLRELLRDPTLSDYSFIMIDEAHERSLHTDVLLPLLKDLVRFRGEEGFRLIISSATLEAEKFSKYFDDAEVLSIPGRVFPVDIYYSTAPVADPVGAAVDTALRIHMENSADMKTPNRDILVFLPGQEEIETAIEAMEERIRKLERGAMGGNKKFKLRDNLLVLPCYSVLPSEQQAKIFEKTPPETRKVVFATNIAETSLTIDGIAYVIDSGFCKRKEFSPKESMDILALAPISRASADQRSGRAGRVAPGKAYRLYTRYCYERELEPIAIPEMQRAHLGSVLLFLSSMGIKDFLEFDFMDPPSVEAIMTALEELYALGALDRKGEITSVGRRMAELPVEPAMAKALVCSASKDMDCMCSVEMIRLCAMLSVSHSLFFRPRGSSAATNGNSKKQQAENSHREFFHPKGDTFTLLNIYSRWMESGYSRQWCMEYFLQFRSLNRARQIIDQLHQLFERNDWPIVSAADNQNNSDWTATVAKCFLSGFFLHSAKLQKRGGFYLPVNRKRTPIKIHPQSALFGKPPLWVVYHHLLETSDKFMREVMEVEPQWIIDVAPHFFQLNSSSSSSSSEKNEGRGGKQSSKRIGAKIRESMAMAANKRKMERVAGRANVNK